MQTLGLPRIHFIRNIMIIAHYSTIIQLISEIGEVSGSDSVPTIVA